MTQIWDFPGGIYPPENKLLSTACPIRNAGIPELLILPLQQHIGAPAETIVAAGDRVLKGQKLADAASGKGVPVHAPTSGIIDGIVQLPVPHPSGMSDWCIVLKPDFHDEWMPLQPASNYRELEPELVLELIHEAGISGMGGAGFPTTIKLKQPDGRSIHTLILNGAECEPYITADDMTMRERADSVIAGLQVMTWLLRPERCLIGIEDNKPEAIAAMRAAITNTQIELVVMPTKYPSGGEKQIIQILTGKEVPSGGIPADIGVMCQNIGTAVAVSQAIFEGKPLISRVITITGDTVQEPGNFDTLLGTPVEYMLNRAGVSMNEVHRLVLGGPMMGYTLHTAKVPLIKTSNCIIAASSRELPDPPPEQPCIRCSLCADVCPMELLPQQLLWHAKASEFEKAEHLNLFDCIECGACSYVCPSSIPLVQYYRYAKDEIRSRKAEQRKADRARERFEARQNRLLREQEEKELRRKERAQAAAEVQAKKEADAQSAGTEGHPIDERAAKAALVAQALARKKAKANKVVPPAHGTDNT
ncbi:MAG TPA: electron transport complex subunit RsxC [Marinobacter sp.]|nr:electron transport complex subunit RsxC [Marinobacter sp.]